MIKSRQKKFICMDTVITIKIVANQTDSELNRAINQAVKCFYQVERCCSRLDPASELMQLCRQSGKDVFVSPMLFHVIQLAIDTATETGGAFDPSIGRKMELRGFNRNYQTQEKICSSFANTKTANYQNIILNESKKAIRFTKPMVLDLNAIAKGLAIDQTAKNLQELGFRHFIIEAGGDIYAGGRNENQHPWRIGIRDPKNQTGLIGTVLLSDNAICTSGGYERPSSAAPGENHLLDPQSNHSPENLSSCTVIAPFAMLADAFSTAAFIMGPSRGISKLEDIGLDGLMVTRASTCFFTNFFKERWSWSKSIQEK